MKFTHTLLAGLALAASTVIGGCGPAASDKPKTTETPATKAAGKTEDDAHAKTPHGGTLVEWGAEEYHVEVVVDHTRGELIGYVLGGDAKTATPIKADTLQLTVKQPALKLDMKAQPQAGDSDGKCSKFVAQDDAFKKDVKLSGVVAGMVNGKPYDGTFEQ